MYVWAFMALIATAVLCARARDLLLSVSVRTVVVVISTLLDLRAEESRVRRHVKQPRFGDASRKPRALSWYRTQAIGALAKTTLDEQTAPYFRHTTINGGDIAVLRAMSPIRF